MDSYSVIGSIAGLILLLPPMAGAHELDAAVRMAAPAVIVHAAYGGSEPVAFVKVQVFAPGSAPAEFQTGVTDRRGNFSFLPDAAGLWRVVVDDEEGHRREVEVTVPEGFQSSTNAQVAAGQERQATRVERALLGVALILGATGFLYGFTARRRPRGPLS